MTRRQILARLRQIEVRVQRDHRAGRALRPGMIEEARRLWERLLELDGLKPPAKVPPP